MTYEEFLERVNRNYAKLGEEWRYGQAYFVVLMTYRPDIAELIRGTLLDSFHKDIISQALTDFIISRW